MRVHGTTRKRPAEVFAQLEAPLLLAAPETPYRVPAWSEAKVQRDFHVRAGNAFYSVPHRLVGQQVSVRGHSSAGTFRPADRQRRDAPRVQALAEVRSSR